MARIKVTINKKGNIPGLGLGPIRRPILITEEKYHQLVKLGYPVKVISSPVKKTVKKEIAVVAVVSIPDKKEITILDEVNEEVAVEVPKEPAVEETVVDSVEEGVSESIEEQHEEEVNTENEEVAEILINDPDLSAEAYYTEDFLTSKKLCKKILANRTVQYDDSASWTLLKQLVSESNPQGIEISEETVESEEVVEE